MLVQGARRSLSDREILGCITKAYGHHIREASRLTGLPADVLTAKVFVESRGQKDARHPDGSVGLSQLQLTTAIEYGVPRNKLLDARENLLGGARVLADYTRKAKGDISLGLVYYNAGPNRQFHRHPGFQPEHFPFVQRVARARAKIEQ